MQISQLYSSQNIQLPEKQSNAMISKNQLKLVRNLKFIISPLQTSEKSKQQISNSIFPFFNYNESKVLSLAKESFINGQLKLNEFLEIRNFPALEFLSTKGCDKTMRSCLKRRGAIKQKVNTIEITQFEQELLQKKKEKAQRNFIKLKKVLNHRIQFKKQIRHEIEKSNPYYLSKTNDPKFFSNLNTISNYMMAKIKNKDLQNVNTLSNYFTSKISQKIIQSKGITLLKEKTNKKSISEMKDGMLYNFKIQKPLYKSFFMQNADNFLLDLQKAKHQETLKKEKEKEIIGNIQQKQQLRQQYLQKKNQSNKISTLSSNLHSKPSTAQYSNFREKNSQKKSNQFISRLLNKVNRKIDMDEPYFTKQNDSTVNTKTNLIRKFHGYKMQIKSEDQAYLKEITDESTDKLRKYLLEQPDIKEILKEYQGNQNPHLNRISDLEQFNDKIIIQQLEQNNKQFRQKVDQIDQFEKNKFAKPLSSSADQKMNEIKRQQQQTLEDLNGSESNDSDLPSLTEVTLDNLYNESIAIQKRVLKKKKNDGVGKKLKQFLKMKYLTKHINEASMNKLYPK